MDNTYKSNLRGKGKDGNRSSYGNNSGRNVQQNRSGNNEPTYPKKRDDIGSKPVPKWKKDKDKDKESKKSVLSFYEKWTNKENFNKTDLNEYFRRRYRIAENTLTIRVFSNPVPGNCTGSIVKTRQQTYFEFKGSFNQDILIKCIELCVEKACYTDIRKIEIYIASKYAQMCKDTCKTYVLQMQALKLSGFKVQYRIIETKSNKFTKKLPKFKKGSKK